MSHSFLELIQQQCIAQNWTLSVAESCTGGGLSAKITSFPGCSKYFLGAVTAYSNDFKIRLLGVEAQLLEEHGAVSRAVVLQMALGMLKLAQSHYSIAVSGIAGPDGGTIEKPVGTIWAAIVGLDVEPIVWNFQLKGTRQEVMEQTVDILIHKFWSLIASKTHNC